MNNYVKNMKQVPKYIREVARKLRNNMTSAEARLWSRVKNEQLGYKFLRQKPIYMFTEDDGRERYIIPDFYCSEKQVIIEVDGGVHEKSEVLELDREREKLLESQGIWVIRALNDDILNNTDTTIAKIQNKITKLSLCKRLEHSERSPLGVYPTKEREGLLRCAWANPKNELYLKYHDEEWGRAVHDDRVLFEFLILEGAQAGLNWETILKKRENYKKAFDDFDYEQVAKYDNLKVQKLLGNEGIIRNKLKIHSAIKNAKVFIQIRKEYGSFSEYLWGYVGGKQIVNHPKALNDIPTSTELSDTLSKNLKKRGMSFVGTTIVYAYLQAVGVVDDHTIDCFCKK